MGLFVAVVAMAAGMRGQAEAATIIAYDNAAVAANQNWLGGSIGMDFDVNRTIRVTELGAFDSGAIANLDTNNGVYVGIFDRTTGSLVAPSVFLTSATPGLSQINGDAFLAVTPFFLHAGFQGSIVAYYDPNYNTFGNVPNATSTTNSGGGAISFVGTSRYNNGVGGLVYPTIIDGGPANRYDAGTFGFTVVPEPSSVVMAGTAAILGLGLTVRNRRHTRAV